MRLLVLLTSICLCVNLLSPPSLPEGIDRYRLDKKPAFRAALPESLREISGLALSAQGSLYAHNDEKAILYQLAPRSGSILKQFWLGERPLKGDFEAIAAVPGGFFLLSSQGVLYQFADGNDQRGVRYHTYPTGLSHLDLEGLCYDPLAGALLLVGKRHPGGAEGLLPVYTFSLKDKRVGTRPQFWLPTHLPGSSGSRHAIKPSDMAFNPLTRTLFVLASQGHALLELSRQGELLAWRHLSSEQHPQPEGLAFAADGTLLISDEGGKHPATLTGYVPRKP